MTEDRDAIADDEWLSRIGFTRNDNCGKTSWTIDNGQINGNLILPIEAMIRWQTIYINRQQVLNEIDTGVRRGVVIDLLHALRVPMRIDADT